MKILYFNSHHFLSIYCNIIGIPPFLCIKRTKIVHNFIARTSYRNNKMDASAFIRICRKFLDSNQFDPLIEELVVLLPDVDRQGALYRALGHPPSLTQCTVCRQILKVEEEKMHAVKYHPPHSNS